MRKLFLIFPLILAACTGMFAPPATVDDERCETPRMFRVFELRQGGALAVACDVHPGSCQGQLAFFRNEADTELYVDKLIRVSPYECFVFDGAYQFRTTDGRQRFAPYIHTIRSQVPNPAYADWLRERNNR